MNHSATNTTSRNIDEGIFQILTQNPNQWMSTVNLYNQYTKEYYINKRDFLINCELLNTRFKNVRKYHRNGLCYLAFVTDNSLISKEVDDEVKNDDLTNDEIFRSLDKCDVIEYMIKNPQNCENLSLTEYFDDTDTVLHILFRKGRVDLVNTLVSCYNVNFDIRNRNDESLLDVLNYNDKNAPKLVKLIFEQQFAKLSENFSNRSNDIKQMNSSLLEINKKLKSENNMLKNEAAFLKFYKCATVVFFLTTVVMYLF